MTMMARRFRKDKKFILGIVLLVVACCVVFSVGRALGASTDIRAETESGTRSANASLLSDSSASGSQAVKFGASIAQPFINGMLTNDPNFFPIAVWSQTPETNAANYKAIGINTFVGMYNGVTHSNLQATNSNGMVMIADQNSVALNDSLSPTTLLGFLPYDEPDNAQWNESTQTYDPCIAVSTLQNVYNQYHAADSLHRPVMLGFGRGVADTSWVGRGSCTGDTQYYRDAKTAADMFAFDVYPVNDGLPLYYPAQGVSNLIGWTGGNKPVWADIETTDFNDTQGPTPAQTKFEVWSAIIHGAHGIDYFCHIFSPSFIEAGVLTDSSMTTMLTSINAQITSLAAVINTGSDTADSVTSSAGSGVPIDTMTKSYGGATYIFAATMRGSATTGTFKPSGIDSGTASVLGESRSINVSGGQFSDSFAGYSEHIYKITP